MKSIKHKSQNVLAFLVLFTGLTVCYFIFPKDQRSTFLLYCSILLISMVFMDFSERLDNSSSRYFFWISIIVIGSIMAFRAQTGIDDIEYKRIFIEAEGKTIWRYFQISGVEKGYLLLNYILYHITCGNYNIAQVIISYITFYFWGLAIREQKGSNRLILLLLLWTHQYFLYMGAGLVRMYLAVSIVFYALHFLKEARYKKYILFILLASTVHISALMMLVMLALKLNKEILYRKWELFLILLAAMFPVVFLMVAKFFVPLLSAWSRYDGYTKIHSFRLSLGDFDVLPVFVIGAYYFFRIEQQYKREYILGMILAGMSVIFSISSSMVTLGRLVYYANLGIMIIISHLFNIKPKNSSYYLVLALLIVYSIVYVMHSGLMVPNHTKNLFPYVSLLNKSI